MCPERGRRMNKTLGIFVRVWIGFAVLVNIVAIIGLFIGAGGFWAGMGQVWEIYSPFNLINWIAEVVLISPAIGAEIWLQKRQGRQLRNQPI